jgi:hypothetical protein
MEHLNIVKYKIFDPQDGVYYDFDSVDLNIALEKRKELMQTNSINPNLTDLHYITGVSLNESGYEVWVNLDTKTLLPVIAE